MLIFINNITGQKLTEWLSLHQKHASLTYNPSYLHPELAQLPWTVSNCSVNKNHWLTVELAGVQVSLRKSQSKKGTGLRDLHFDKLSRRLIAYGILLKNYSVWSYSKNLVIYLDSKNLVVYLMYNMSKIKRL